MTSPDSPSTQQPAFEDRVYRSSSALAGGVLLLALGAWLGGDALARGENHTRLVAVAGLLFVVPLVVAFTLRPAVFAGAERLRVRNPFRTMTLPWASVESLRATYSSEVVAGGAKYQLWAIPVSLRQRKKATRVAARAGAEESTPRAQADLALDELRDLAERHATAEGAQGTPVVRWAYEIIAPSAVGAVALALAFGLG